MLNSSGKITKKLVTARSQCNKNNKKGSKKVEKDIHCFVKLHKITTEIYF